MWQHRYAATRSPYFTYLVSRLWRLLPAFFLISIIAIIYNLAIGSSLQQLRESASWPHFIASNLIIFGYYSLPFKPILPAWSLDVELQFYVVAPVLIVLFRKISRPAISLLFVAAIAIFSEACLSFLPLSGFVGFFLIGIVAASLKWQPSSRLAAFSIIATILLVVGCLLSQWKGILLLGAHPGPLHIYNAASNYLLALVMAPYAIYTTRQKGSVRDGMYADLSYIVYLFHWIGVCWWATQTGSTLHRASLIVLVFVVVLFLSLLVWKFYDKPINILRSNWVSKRKINVVREEAGVISAAEKIELTERG